MSSPSSLVLAQYFLVVIGSILPGVALHAQPTSQPTPDEPPTQPSAAAAPAARPVIVEGRTQDLLGIAQSATEGQIGQRQLSQRPLFRTGELIETVPGYIATQHSGSGKANQYYVRGFNLDHGTDFAVFMMGMPVNMPTHAHGQGYTDINFIIPELVNSIGYRKGPYYADIGDFGSAGAVHFDYFTRLDESFANFSVGNYDHARAVLGTSFDVWRGTALFGGEIMTNDGSWDVGEDLQKLNTVTRYTLSDVLGGSLSLTAMGYDSEWTATDQVPERAVRQGIISRFGTLDSSNGGTTRRYSLSANWCANGADWKARALAWFADYQLDLFSNFTYFLDDPVNGDQFEQRDRRLLGGMDAAYTHFLDAGRMDFELTGGMQLRHDHIQEVALYHTSQRRRIATTRKSGVRQTSISPYAEARARFTQWLRANAGLRADMFAFTVRDTLKENSGSSARGMVNPKLGLAAGPFHKTEVYLNGGLGFHSNDARGVRTTVDPGTGDRLSAVNPLVRSYGADLGARTHAIDGLVSTLSLWWLEIESELLFIGDAGTTEASRRSRRIGIEITNYYAPVEWLTIDLDIALSRARFTDPDPAGNRIPGAATSVIAAGAHFHGLHGFFGGPRLRYFGPRPLVEDNSHRSRESALVGLQAGYNITPKVKVTLEVFNLFDSRYNDVEYFYESQLQSDAGPVEDIHFHPAERTSLRLIFEARW